MPSVEIVCHGQTEPTHFVNIPFKVYAENKLVSHRTPSPLFQSDFDELSGCIYHFVKHPKSAYTAGDLLDQWYGGLLKFKTEYVPFVKQILSSLLEASPTGSVLFTSDYQFGGKPKRYKHPIRFSKFWELHEANKIKPNALYMLIKD